MTRRIGFCKSSVPDSEFLRFLFVLFRPRRLSGHLQKCRHVYLRDLKKPWPEGRMEICTYNYLHHLPESKMTEHMENCDENPKRYWKKLNKGASVSFIVLLLSLFLFLS